MLGSMANQGDLRRVHKKLPTKPDEIKLMTVEADGTILTQTVTVTEARESKGIDREKWKEALEAGCEKLIAGTIKWSETWRGSDVETFRPTRSQT